MSAVFLLTLLLGSSAWGLDLGSLLGLPKLSAIPEEPATPELVEVVRWRQPVCLLAEEGVPPCLQGLRDFQDEYELLSRPTPSLESEQQQQQQQQQRGRSLFEGKRPPAIYVSKVINAPVTATLVARNCLPDIGVPLCEQQQQQRQSAVQGLLEKKLALEMDIANRGQSLVQGIAEKKQSLIQGIADTKQSLIQRLADKKTDAVKAISERTQEIMGTIGVVKPLLVGSIQQNLGLGLKESETTSAPEPEDILLDERSNGSSEPRSLDRLKNAVFGKPFGIFENVSNSDGGHKAASLLSSFLTSLFNHRKAASNDNASSIALSEPSTSAPPIQSLSLQPGFTEEDEPIVIVQETTTAETKTSSSERPLVLPLPGNVEPHEDKDNFLLLGDLVLVDDHDNSRQGEEDLQPI